MHIDLVRRLPEAMKPRRIEVGSGAVTVKDTKASCQSRLANGQSTRDSAVRNYLNCLLKGEAVMLVNWKPLALAATGITSILWLGPHDNSGEAHSTSELAMNAGAIRSCLTQGARCLIDIGYAYPAGELFVLPEDAYF